MSEHTKSAADWRDVPGCSGYGAPASTGAAPARKIEDLSAEHVSDIVELVREVTKERTRAEHAEAERDALKQEEADADRLRERLAELLAGVAVALRGEPAPLHSHGWSDLPERAAEMRRRAEHAEAEVQRLASELRSERGDY